MVAQLQQVASACTRASTADMEPAALARCTIAQLEARLAGMGIRHAAAFTVGPHTACGFGRWHLQAGHSRTLPPLHPLLDQIFDHSCASQGRQVSGGGAMLGGLREVWAHWLGDHVARLGSRFANPFVKDYKTLPGRCVQRWTRPVLGRW